MARVASFAESDRPWHDRGGGVRTSYLVRRETGDVGFLTGITEFKPGAELSFHSHNCDESVVVLDGEATFETKEGVQRLGRNDATWIAACVVHRFVNRGPRPLRILWIYGSPDATRTIVDTGESRPIAEEAAAAHGC
jgi:mannose-6-phosphate isomerase-like protein (cupin superfamily)